MYDTLEEVYISLKAVVNLVNCDLSKVCHYIHTRSSMIIQLVHECIECLLSIGICHRMIGSEKHWEIFLNNKMSSRNNRMDFRISYYKIIGFPCTQDTVPKQYKLWKWWNIKNSNRAVTYSNRTVKPVSIILIE